MLLDQYEIGDGATKKFTASWDAPLYEKDFTIFPYLSSFPADKYFWSIEMYPFIHSVETNSILKITSSH